MTMTGYPDPVRPGDRRRHVGDRLRGARKDRQGRPVRQVPSPDLAANCSRSWATTRWASATAATLSPSPSEFVERPGRARILNSGTRQASIARRRCLSSSTLNLQGQSGVLLRYQSVERQALSQALGSQCRESNYSLMMLTPHLRDSGSWPRSPPPRGRSRRGGLPRRGPSSPRSPHNRSGGLLGAVPRRALGR